MANPFAERSFADDADRAACAALIRNGSKTFSAASLLLPASVRDPAYALYAFCRLSDDLVDVEGGASDAIERLRQRLDRAYSGRPADHAVDRAFADVVVQHAIPRSLPEALIDGLEWDVSGVVCETIEDLYDYAARVAGSVGAMMSTIMGVRDPDAVARACDLGVAMQLTNVARDVGEDARAGRLYLPRSWLRAGGLDIEQWLARPVYNEVIGVTVKRLLDTAEILYARADAGIGSLPARCRPGIFAARHLYREIGMEVVRRGFDSVSARARVSDSRKLGLLGRIMVDAVWSNPETPMISAMAETRYLVEAVAASHPWPSRSAGHRRPGVADRVLWVAELFASLEARDRISG